eukprot:SM000044S15997  [mRNA]  locus=s44:414240:415030:- [translate_table: standard]
MRWCTDSPLILAVVDVELTLVIRVGNRNVVPITYANTTMDIFYRGQLLGQAQVLAGSHGLTGALRAAVQVPSGGQGARSERVMELPCKLDGLEISSHMLALLSDVAARKMAIHSLVTISGEARLLFLRHTFKVLSPLAPRLCWPHASEPVFTHGPRAQHLCCLQSEAAVTYVEVAMESRVQIYVDSDLDIDPVMLNVLDQDNRVNLELGPVKIDKG